MITHSIKIYNPIEDKKPSWEMGKLEYALFLKNLPYGVGDYVVSKHATLPLLKKEVYRVVNIDELHRFVTFKHPSVGPLCLTLANIWGQTLSERYGANLYRKVSPQEFPK